MKLRELADQLSARILWPNMGTCAMVDTTRIHQHRLPEFFHLDDYVVSTVSCGNYYLVPRTSYGERQAKLQAMVEETKNHLHDLLKGLVVAGQDKTDHFGQLKLLYEKVKTCYNSNCMPSS